jgi:hypothetical protein
LKQADKLIASSSPGPPRQVDLRRAISSAYYSVFHAVVTAAADQFVGVSKRSTALYGLVYRSVDHGWLRTLCTELKKPVLASGFQPYVSATEFGNDIVALPSLILLLQQKRHRADYDPVIRVPRSEAVLAVSLARTALTHLRSATAVNREAFATLLLFPPRR